MAIQRGCFFFKASQLTVIWPEHPVIRNARERCGANIKYNLMSDICQIMFEYKYLEKKYFEPILHLIK